MDMFEWASKLPWNSIFLKYPNLCRKLEFTKWKVSGVKHLFKNSLGYIRLIKKTSKIVNNLKGQKRENWETTQTVNLNGKYSKRWILWHITTLPAAALSFRAVRDWLMLHREKGHMAAGYCWQKGSKLDGVDDRPSTDYLQHVKKNYGTWHLTADTWHMTHDTWHMTYDMWHVTHC